MLAVGQIVSGVVTESRVFGVFVEIGEPEPGLLLVDALSDSEPSSAALDALPQVGSRIRAVFLGYGAPGGTQPRLSTRPSDFEGSRTPRG